MLNQTAQETKAEVTIGHGIAVASDAFGTKNVVKGLTIAQGLLVSLCVPQAGGVGKKLTDGNAAKRFCLRCVRKKRRNGIINGESALFTQLEDDAA